MNAVAVVSIYVVTNRASYLKCDVSVSVYVAVVWIQDQATGPGLLDGLCQTMLLVTTRLVSDNHCQKPLISGAFLFYVSPPHTLFWIVILLKV